MKSAEEIKQETNLAIRRITEDGGYADIKLPDSGIASVIWSNGGGWEHVSTAPYRHIRIPTWRDMCYLKSKFFHADEVVVEYHPAEENYVNNMPNCLHLWRPIKDEMPCPPTIMVGIRDAQTKESVEKEIIDIVKTEDEKNAEN